MWIDKHRLTIEGKEYRLQRYIDATAEDLHHIIGRSLKYEWYATNASQNKVKIKRRKHVALNSFFWAEWQAPHLQLKQCLELREPVLSDWVREALYEILSLPKSSFYKDELVTKKHKNDPLFPWELDKNLKETL